MDILRVLVTGSQLWTDRRTIFDALDQAFNGSSGMMVVVHGACPNGADAIASQWVRGMRLIGFMVEEEPHPANWKEFKKAAGFRRNAEMVKLGADICLAFILDESPGSTHTKELAEKAGIDTEVFRKRTPMGAVVKRVDEELMIEDARLIFRNFEGAEKQYNTKGKRNFSVALDEPLALKLIEDGWNVKSREKDGETLYHLKVNVKMDGRKPPRVWMITKSKNRRTLLDEDTVMLLDVAEFDEVDVIIRPYNWDVQGQQGVSAYLKTLFATIHEDELEQKYAHIPDSEEPLAIENIIDAEVDMDSGWIDDGDEPKALER